MAAKLDTMEMLPVRYKIASILRKAILAGEYSEGEELSLTHTADQIGVSRTPVREAFQMLATEGLIELRLNKGAIFKGIDVNIIREHFDFRILLECEAVARAALSGMDTSELELEQSKIEENIKHAPPQDFQEYNQRFHTSICKQVNNQKIYSTLTSLWNGSSFGRTTPEQEHFQISIKEHRLILDNIMKGDPYNARKEMETHLIRSMNNIINSYNFQEIQLFFIYRMPRAGQW